MAKLLMLFKETVKIAFRALHTNRTRSFLTMLGIIIGIASVILLVSIGKGLETYITEQLEGLGANSLFIMPGELNVGEGHQGGVPGAGVAAPKFTFDHLVQIKREAKTVKAAMAYIENNATFRYQGKVHTTQVVGCGPEYPKIRDQKLVLGSFFSQNQYSAAKKVVVLGQTVADELFGNSNPVGKKLTLADQRFTVIGVLEEKGGFAGVDVDNQAFIPATTSVRLFDLDYLQSLWVQSQNRKTVTASQKEVEKILGKTLDDDEFSVLDTQSVLTVITRILGMLTIALAGIAAISLVVGGVGIMNIMLVSVTERTREIGLRKAVGATPKNILGQFLVEALGLSLIGGFIGISLGIGGSLALGRLITTTTPPWAVLLAFSVAVLVGLVFGLAPALRAARLNPIDALRYE